MAVPDPIMPELRAYPCFDTLPAGCFAHFIGDKNSEPLLCLGEIVVIDPSQRDYVESELFLIEWQSRPGARELVMPKHRKRGRYDPVDQLTPLYVSSFAAEPLRTLDGEVMTLAVRWADGPYSPDQLASMFLGRVIGILQPAFDETTMRRAN